MAMKYTLPLIAGLILGYLIFSWMDKDSVIIETVTEYETDTIYVHITDTVKINTVKHEYLRDTILIEPIEPKIKRFTASYSFLYGNAHLEGEVLGEVLKTSIITDFNLPTITNTITTTNTVIKKPAGLFITAGLGGNFSTPYIGATFIKDRFLVGLNTGGFQVGYKLSK